MTTETRWYDDPGSACPTCGHGPRYHNDPSGCTRMNGGWCPCERVYGALSQGPDDYAGQDGSYYKPAASDVIAGAIPSRFIPTLTDAERAVIAAAVLRRLERAGYGLLGPCGRCGQDPTAHWCADLEETYND